MLDALIPLSQETYNFFEEFFGIKRQFMGEAFHYLENNTFMGRECPNSLVAAIDNIIYKIFYHFHNKNEDEFMVLTDNIFYHLA